MLPGNYLIAGATGLMGTHMLMRLSNVPGIKVRAVFHLRKPVFFADNISYVQADLRNCEDCKSLVAGMDYVFMFAGILSTAAVIAKNPVSPVTENIVMNSMILEAAYLGGVKKFLWLSSSTGYPQSDMSLKEEQMFEGDPVDVNFPVGWMSRYTEILCRMYSTKLKNPMACVILRPTTIYGEHEDFHFETCHVLPALVRRVVERHNPIEVWGSGENTRDFIYAGDVVEAALLALVRVDKFDVFNIGFGTEYSIKGLLKVILEVDGYHDAKIVCNVTKPATVLKRTLDLTKSREVLGFKAKTTLREGIARVVAWYRQNPIKEAMGA